MVEKVSHLKIRESGITDHFKELQRALNDVIRRRELYFIRHYNIRSDVSIACIIQQNEATKSTISDRGDNEVIAHLANSSKKGLSLWFGLYESWQKHKNAKLLFKLDFGHFVMVSLTRGG